MTTDTTVVSLTGHAYRNINTTTTTKSPNNPPHPIMVHFNPLFTIYLRGVLPSVQGNGPHACSAFNLRTPGDVRDRLGTLWQDAQGCARTGGGQGLKGGLGGVFGRLEMGRPYLLRVEATGDYGDGRLHLNLRLNLHLPLVGGRSSRVN